MIRTCAVIILLAIMPASAQHLRDYYSDDDIYERQAQQLREQMQRERWEHEQEMNRMRAEFETERWRLEMQRPSSRYDQDDED